MSTIAIVTGSAAPELTTDGRRLRAELEDRGHDAVGVRWDDADVDWSAFDVAVVRSCWEYYADPDGFRAWLDELEAAGVSVRNPPDVIRWNLHKSYLRDLADAGVSIVPTEVVLDARDADLAAILEDRGWDSAVVKPAIGTSGAGAWKTTRATAATDQTRFERPFRATRRHESTAAADDPSSRLPRRGALVQEFVPEVADGERSLAFFAGEYSHAWANLGSPDWFDLSPNDDDMTDYAPSAETLSWAADVLRTAAAVLDIDPASLPYARVDLLRRGEERLLLELELIEPHLNLSAGDGAVDRLASAIGASLAVPDDAPNV